MADGSAGECYCITGYITDLENNQCVSCENGYVVALNGRTCIPDSECIGDFKQIVQVNSRDVC